MCTKLSEAYVWEAFNFLCFVLPKEHKPVIAHRTIPKPCQQKANQSCTAHERILSNGHVHGRSNNLLESKAKPGGMIDKEPQLYPAKQIHRPPDLAAKAVYSISGAHKADEMCKFCSMELTNYYRMVISVSFHSLHFSIAV